MWLACQARWNQLWLKQICFEDGFDDNKIAGEEKLSKINDMDLFFSKKGHG